MCVLYAVFVFILLFCFSCIFHISFIFIPSVLDHIAEESAGNHPVDFFSFAKTLETSAQELLDSITKHIQVGGGGMDYQSQCCISYDITYLLQGLFFRMRIPPKAVACSVLLSKRQLIWPRLAVCKVLANCRFSFVVQLHFCLFYR